MGENFKQNIHRALLYAFYYLVLGVIYSRSGFLDLYSYMGYQGQYSLLRDVFGVCVAFIFASRLSGSINPIMLLRGFALYIILVPSLVLYAHAGASHNYIMVTILAHLVIFSDFNAELSLSQAPFFGIIHVKVLLDALIIVLLIGVCLIVYKTGLSYFNIDITRVYELRPEIARQLPFFFAYLNKWLGFVVCPFLLVFGLKYGKGRYILSGGLGGLLLFAFTAHKAPAGSVILVLISFYIFDFFDKQPRFAKNCLVGVVSALLVVSFVDFYSVSAGGNGLFYIGSLFYRRIILLPSYLNSHYIEIFGHYSDFWFFSDKQFTFGLIDQPSDVSITHYVGEFVFGNPDCGANVGWVGSGYAQLGHVGVIIYSVCLTFYTKIFDAVSHHYGANVIGPLFLNICFSFVVSSDFFTSMITHGGLLLVMLLATIKPTRHFQFSEFEE